MDIYNPNFLEYVEQFLPMQYEKATNTKKLLNIFLAEQQEFQTEVYKLFEQGLNLDTATGYQLDIIGKLSNTARNGLSDEDYRQEIRLQRFLANSSGTIPEIHQYVTESTKGDSVRIIEHFPRSFCVQTDGDIPNTDFASSVDKVSAAGVTAHSVIHRWNDDNLLFTRVEDSYITPLVSAGETGMQAGESTATATSWLANTTTTPANSILYRLQDLYTIPPISAGESIMHSGEEQAIASSILDTDASDNRGTLSRVYTLPIYAGA